MSQPRHPYVDPSDDAYAPSAEPVSDGYALAPYTQAPSAPEPYPESQPPQQYYQAPSPQPYYQAPAPQQYYQAPSPQQYYQAPAPQPYHQPTQHPYAAPAPQYGNPYAQPPQIIIQNNSSASSVAAATGGYRMPPKQHSLAVHIVLLFLTGGIGNLIYWWSISNENRRRGY